MFRKGANLFLGRNQPAFGGLLPGFLCSKSVREIICFSGRMTGGLYSGKTGTKDAVPGFAWASLPLNGIFNPEDGFVGCDRQEKF